jgi:hypothetical protein
VNSSSDTELDPKIHRRAMRRLGVYILATILVSAFLLILNVGVVYTLFGAVAQRWLPEIFSKKVSQFVMFTVPVLLLIPEWLVYDRLVSPLRHKR